MEQFIHFAQNSSPVIILLALLAGMIHIVILLLKSKGIISSISTTQKKKYPEMEEMFKRVIEELNMANKIATNHTHNIPDIYDSQKRIEDSLIRLTDKIDKGNEILIKIESKIK